MINTDPWSAISADTRYYPRMEAEIDKAEDIQYVSPTKPKWSYEREHSKAVWISRILGLGIGTLVALALI